MQKTDLINEIASRTKNTKTSSELFLNSFMEIIKETLTKGEDITLMGFGSFKTTTTKARTGRNPQTGKEIKIPEGKKVKFTVGKGLKEAVK